MLSFETPKILFAAACWVALLGFLMAGGAFGAVSLSESTSTLDPGATDDEPLVAREVELADLRFANGVRMVFTYDELSGDFGLLQEGQLEVNGPLIHGHVDSLLDAYLEVTLGELPVPELLLAEPAAEIDLGAKLAGRRIAQAPVYASDLPVLAKSLAKNSCFTQHLNWVHWRDTAQAGMAPKSYYASGFGGKRRYSDSYIFNCTPAGSPSYLWARHRIYYKNGFGNYIKHFEGKVGPNGWQEKHKGSSVKRYRRVTYDDNWNSSPSCGSCKYTREGRFHN